MKILLITFAFHLQFLAAQVSEKYDTSQIPFDLRPVMGLVGVWQLQETVGTPQWIKPPDVLDFGINRIPMFGARALNITGHYKNSWKPKQEEMTIYGFMPVKNATRRDPRVHAAFITTYGNGINIIEQGLVHGAKKVRFHLKQYMKRSFGLGEHGSNFVIDQLEREIEISPTKLEISVQALTNEGSDDYKAIYYRRY